MVAAQPSRGLFAVQVGFSLVSLVVPLWQPIAGLLIATFSVAATTGARRARWGWVAAVPLVAHAWASRCGSTAS